MEGVRESVGPSSIFSLHFKYAVINLTAGGRDNPN